MLPRHPLRAGLRLVGFLTIVGRALVDYGVQRLLGGVRDPVARAMWLHRWTGRALRFMKVRVVVEGAPPRDGLIASNHLGYLDVFALSAAAPVVFVSRADVADWPIAGLLTRLAGTIFIDRSRRSDVIRVGEAIVPVVAGGLPVAIFLEGTSTGGDRVLPFHSSLLGPAVRQGWRVTPAFLSYSAPDARPERDLCYWGDAVFFPHFLNVLGLAQAEVRIRFGDARVASGDRRALAAQLRRDVCALGGCDDRLPEAPITR